MALHYNYSVVDNKVYCFVKYAGSSVVGVAKCDTSSDKFNEEVGMNLAKLRCQVKVTKKKLDRAAARVMEADKILAEAQARATRLRQSYLRIVKEGGNICKELDALEASLK